MSEKDLNKKATEADLENVSGGSVIDNGRGKGFTVTHGNYSIDLKGFAATENNALAVDGAFKTVSLKNKGGPVTAEEYNAATKKLLNVGFNGDLNSL